MQAADERGLSVSARHLNAHVGETRGRLGGSNGDKIRMMGCTGYGRLFVGVLMVLAWGCKFPYPGDVPLDGAENDAAVDATDDGGGDVVTLTVIRGGAATGTVTSDPDGIVCGATCSYAFPRGQLVTLTVTPGSGADFGGWGGACTGILPTCTLTVANNTTVTADFAVANYDITILVGGNGTGTVMGTGINCPGDCTHTVVAGNSLVLTAAASGGSSFVGWSGGGCTGLSTTCNISPLADASINASFALNNSLVVARIGNGAGTVTAPGIDCPGDCSEAYSPGQMVTVVANPAATSDFIGWSGACSGTTTCMVTLDMAKMVTAEFRLKQYTLTVTRDGAGVGSVSSNPVGITCGTTCAATFNHGQVVQLTPAVGVGYEFTAWGSACSGAGACSVTMDAPKSVNATFEVARHTLTLTKSAVGTGTVVSSPMGINCNAGCSTANAQFLHNTTVMLTATPSGGHSFAGWNGGGCSGLGTCMVTMSAATTVDALFDPPVNVVFATSTTHTGNLGGLVGADAICQARAQAAGLSGTFRAWVSTAGASAASRLAGSNGWVRTDGKPFAKSLADLVGGKILYAGHINEFGLGTAGYSLTGTAPNGSSTGSTCNEWTSASGSMFATRGIRWGTSGVWTSEPNGSGSPCSTPSGLICFGTGLSTTPRVPLPAQYRRAFVSTGTWAPGGGIASADAVCAGEAAAASLAGTFKALLQPAVGQSAASRFSDGPPWVRIDGVAIQPTAAMLLSFGGGGVLDASLNVTTSGGYVTSRVWSSFPTATSSQTCQNWTSTDSAEFASTGDSNYVNTNGFDGASGYCNESYALYCLQQ